jgi:hypothetical protein
MNLKSVASLCLALVAIAACGGSDDADAVLYKSAGSLQCSPSQTTQVRLDSEVSSLRAAGATVTASHCANDGAVHPAGCGMSNGDLFSVTVSPASASPAQQRGYLPASEFPAARTMACR